MIEVKHGHGILPDGHRSILDTSCVLSEAEVHWQQFLQSLVQRDMYGVKFIVSDDHAGLRAAGEAQFQDVRWQRCQFHLIRNAMGYVPRMSMCSEVAQDLRTIFDTADREEAGRRLRLLMGKYQAFMVI